MKNKTMKPLLTVFLYCFCLTVIMVELASCSIRSHKTKNNITEIESVEKWISDSFPKNITHYKTTDSGIYLTNLNSSINVFSRLYSENGNPTIGNKLAEHLYFRYRILGDFKDATDALALISALNQENPENTRILLTQAKIFAGFHQFSKATNSLQKAKLYGAKTKSIQTLQEEIEFSLGHYKPFEEIINDSSINALDKAKYALLNNHFEQASHYFKITQEKYSDSGPYKLAWLQMQQGIAFLRYGALKPARIFFQAAHNRFPTYYLVTEHLAETELLLGNYKAAQILYQQVSQQTDNPEFYAQLAKVERALGHTKIAKLNLQKAQQGFDELTKDYPLAMGDHAVQFYLDNSQIEKASYLAETNLENRKNIESYFLIIKVAQAKKDKQLACINYAITKTINANPIEMIQLSSELSCEKDHLTINP